MIIFLGHGLFCVAETTATVFGWIGDNNDDNDDDELIVGPAFTNKDIGKLVEINGGKVKVNGIDRTVFWGEAEYADLRGKIGICLANP